ncbi:MAG: hypothetical protein FJ343_07605 [Sphingomonadales bacterium]|nr:hypothetical protein [Sphingomonadales bacterium]
MSKGVQRGRLNASAKTWAALDKGARRAGTTARPPRTAPGSGGGGLGARWARLTGGAWRGSK